MKRLFTCLVFVLLAFLLYSCTATNPLDIESFLETDELSNYEKNSYYLDLYLDEKSGELLVEGKIVYVNDKQDFDEIYLTMFPNAFNADTSTDNNVNFEYLTVDGIEYNVVFSGEDKTSIHLDLENTLEYDSNCLIEFKYKFDYWDFGRICQVDDNYYITMFFYPYVSVYDEFGWNIEPYSFTGEGYYNEIGDYFVAINVPDDFSVACSGKKIETGDPGKSRKEITYKLLNGRDFSFGACSYYSHYIRLIDDITYEIYATSDLYVSEIELAFNTMVNSYNIYSNLIGPYEYNHITLELGFVYGMESSGLIFCSREISEGTIVHEMVHQWFYSLIGNDQSDFSFIDESLTTFSTGLYYKEIYGEVGGNEYYSHRDSYREDLIDHFNNSLGSTMLRKVDEFENEYAYIIYYHGVTLFRHYIEHFLDGDYELFTTFMRTYYDTYKYDVVSLDEFLNLLEETTGVEETYEWFMLMLNEFQDVNNMP